MRILFIAVFRLGIVLCVETETLLAADLRTTRNLVGFDSFEYSTLNLSIE